MEFAGRYQSAVAVAALVFLAGGIFVYTMFVIGASTESDANLRIVEARLAAATTTPDRVVSPGGKGSELSDTSYPTKFEPPRTGASESAGAGQNTQTQSKPSGSEYKRKPLPQGKININTASAERLAELPGIGPVLAGRIVQYRIDNGFFAAPEDIINVKGIGEKKLEGMLPYIEVE